MASIDLKYPGVFNLVEAKARLAVKELLGDEDAGACFGEEGTSGKRLTFFFNSSKIILVDGFFVVPMPLASLKNCKYGTTDGASFAEFTFDNREFKLRGIPSGDLYLISPLFTNVNEESLNSEIAGLDSKQEVIIIATTQFIPAHEVQKVYGIVYSSQSSFDLALNEVKKHALEFGANAVIGLTLIDAHTSATGSHCETSATAYGTAVRIAKQ